MAQDGRKRNLDVKKVIKQRIDKKMSLSEIAASADVSKQAVSQLLQRVKSSDILATYINKRSDAYSILEHDLLNSIDQEDIKKSSLLQKVTAAGILKTHYNLETGKATSINETDIRGVIALIAKVEGNDQNTAENNDPPITIDVSD